MRSTVVPAQVTTIEDRVAGNLGISQLILLIAPVFLGSILYVALPPFFGYHIYKIVLLALLAVVCGLLAIRIKGQILLLWILRIVTYNLRPRYFVYSKNSLHNREVPLSIKADKTQVKTQVVKPIAKAKPLLSTADLVKVEDILTSPSANVRYTTDKKGGIRVHITEVQSQSAS